VTPNAGWQIQNGSTTDIPADELEGVKAQILNQTFASPLSIDLEAEKSTSNFAIQGIEKLGDAKCYKMQITPKDTGNNKSVGNFWFETNTYLLRKIVFSGGENEEQNFAMEVKEYQNVGGYIFPKMLELTIGQDQNVSVEFKNIKVNEPIDDGLFKK
ncbi:MAG: outer membrane lipoprotein-sorting protein, partial [Candidatus Kapaibacteriota bacterium]